MIQKYGATKFKECITRKTLYSNLLHNDLSKINTFRNTETTLPTRWRSRSPWCRDLVVRKGTNLR